MKITRRGDCSALLLLQQAGPGDVRTADCPLLNTPLDPTHSSPTASKTDQWKAFWRTIRILATDAAESFLEAAAPWGEQLMVSHALTAAWSMGRDVSSSNCSTIYIFWPCLDGTAQAVRCCAGQGWYVRCSAARIAEFTSRLPCHSSVLDATPPKDPSRYRGCAACCSLLCERNQQVHGPNDAVPRTDKPSNTPSGACSSTHMFRDQEM